LEATVALAGIGRHRYGGRKGTVRIEDGYVEGNFPSRVRSLLLEWWDLHREELAEDWRLAQERKQVKPIRPLE
jgi:hypothetical protein